MTPHAPSVNVENLSDVGEGGNHRNPDTTHKSAPERSCTSIAQGPCRPKGHDRLVNSLDAPNVAPEATCPICGRPGSGNLHDNGWGVASAHYLDDAGHIWTTKWLSFQEVAA